MKIKLTQASVLALCIYAATAEAAPWDKPTDAEIAALPPYCQAKLSGVAFDQWRSALGPIYEHVHHYCGARIFLSRYYGVSSPKDRGYLLGEVLNNLNYMIRLTGPSQSSPLMPEIHLTKGRALVLLGKHADAANEFLRAIQLKPDYADAYLAMADFYVRLEKKQDALNFLHEGLRQTPTSRKLARRYQELGGKLPLPDMAPPPVAEPSRTEAQPVVPAEAGNKVVEGVPVVSPQTSKPEQLPPSDAPSEKIGSPSNPWCRFCTDDESTPAEK